MRHVLVSLIEALRRLAKHDDKYQGERGRNGNDHLRRRSLLRFFTLACGITALACWPRAQGWSLPYHLDSFVDNLLLDQYFRLRTAPSPQQVAETLPHTRDIVMVELSHQIPRPLLAKVLWKLRQARVVALDLMLIDHERDYAPDETMWYRDEFARWRHENQELAGVMRRTGNVVVGTWPEEERRDSPSRPGSYTAHTVWRRPPDAIWNAARAHGHLVVDERAGIVRHVRLWQQTPMRRAPRQSMPCLGWVLASLGSRQPVNPIAVNPIARVQADKPELKFRGRAIPLEADGSLLINFVGSRASFEFDTNRIVYQRVLDGFEPEDFADKIVIVGETSLQSKEISQTPFGAMPSMQLHANIVATLLDPRGPPAPLALWQVALISLGAGLLLVLPILRLPLWGRLLMAVAQSAVLLLLGAWIFTTYHKVLPGSVPLLTIVLFYNAIALYEYWRTRQTLGRFIGQEMVPQMLPMFSTPEVGGREEVATALFCDMRDYSTLAEQMSPTQVTDLITEYNGVINQVATAHGGRAIDYQGDGAFVLFEHRMRDESGAGGHALRAVQAALELQQGFAAMSLRREKLDMAPLRFGVGVATGPMLIGILGSSERLHLGAVGDTINVASRVQGLTKTCGYNILVTSATYQQAEPSIEAVSCGAHKVKGREQLVEIYGILGLKAHTKNHTKNHNLGQKGAPGSFPPRPHSQGDSPAFLPDAAPIAPRDSRARSTKGRHERKK